LLVFCTDSMELGDAAYRLQSWSVRTVFLNICTHPPSPKDSFILF